MADERAQRRLAAILAADVAGYTRLMQADEAGTLAALKTRRSEILQPLVAKHHGRVVKVMGDGVLVEFASVLNAVQCGIELQDAMAAANVALPEDLHIVLRVGINLGDVMVEGGDIYGDGVNIASRLEAAADPGTILVSGKVREEVAGKLGLTFEDLGQHTLKNLATPMQIYRVSGAASAVPAAAPGKVSDHSRPSIAVLPFTNMSGDPVQDYFSDGVERYDRTLEDIFAVQDEVIATIVATLTGRLAASGAERAQRKPPQLWAAYDHVLQGREHLQRFDAEAAAPLLRRAIELDPAYAPAYGWLALANYVLYSAHGRAEDLAEGLRVAQKAVALDPVDSCSHRALAMIYSLMRQYDLAGVHYDRAIALNPNDVDASTLHGLWLTMSGRGEEALRSMEADLRHNPFPPTWYWECRGIASFQARRYAEAIEAYQHMDLLHWWTYCYIAACYSHLDEPELAKRAAAEVLRLKPDFSMTDLERSEYWRDPADLEHLKDGLRIAGLG